MICNLLPQGVFRSSQKHRHPQDVPRCQLLLSTSGLCGRRQPPQQRGGHLERLVLAGRGGCTRCTPLLRQRDRGSCKIQLKQDLSIRKIYGFPYKTRCSHLKMTKHKQRDMTIRVQSSRLEVLIGSFHPEVSQASVHQLSTLSFYQEERVEAEMKQAENNCNLFREIYRCNMVQQVVLKGFTDCAFDGVW